MNKHEIEKQIRVLKEYAKSKGLSIRFRDHETAQGDFCIFIYDKSFRKNFIVGYDGDWSAYPESVLSFSRFLSMAYSWIDNRDSRFELVNGKWAYKRFLLTADGVSPNDYCMTIEDAGALATKYKNEGHTRIACFDTGADGNKCVCIKVW